MLVIPLRGCAESASRAELDSRKWRPHREMTKNPRRALLLTVAAIVAAPFPAIGAAAPKADAAAPRAAAAAQATADDPAALVTEGTIAGLQTALRRHRVSCEGIVRAYLDRIASLDKARGLNAISAVNPQALEMARHLDRDTTASSARMSLYCVPLLVKDNIDTLGLPTTGGSVAMLHNIPTENAFIVRNLEAAGAIVLAKTNMAEWAFSPRDSVSSSYGVTANAYDQSRTPAGSSGGTAAGVAASFAVAGLGTDTGNSVRGPASHAALVGLRPTLGLISRSGIIPLELDRDTAGPLTRTVEDNARLLNILAASDPSDPLTLESSRRRPPDYTRFLRSDALRGARIGVVRELARPEVTAPEVLESFNAAIRAPAAGGRRDRGPGDDCEPSRPPRGRLLLSTVRVRREYLSSPADSSGRSARYPRDLCERCLFAAQQSRFRALSAALGWRSGSEPTSVSHVSCTSRTRRDASRCGLGHDRSRSARAHLPELADSCPATRGFGHWLSRRQFAAALATDRHAGHYSAVGLRRRRADRLAISGASLR